MEYEVVRLALAGLALAGLALAPAAICDARSRSVPVWWLGLGWAAACMFAIHDVVWGGMGWWPGGAAAALGVLCGGLLVAASRHVMLGAADGHIMAISCMMLPWYGGVPTALCGIAAGCAAALAWMVALNVWYNLRDMAGGRAIPLRDLFACHRKRPGERFAVGVARSGPVHMGDSGIVRDAAGDLFEPARAEGGRVRPVAPMALFVVSGVLAVSAYVTVLAPIFG